jgi:hypothetical protein
MSIAWLINYNNKLYDPVEIPSLQEIEQMDRKRDQGLDAVEISISEAGEPRHVKCQKCGNIVPIVAKLNRPKNDRVVILQHSGLKNIITIIIMTRTMTSKQQEQKSQIY